MHNFSDVFPDYPRSDVSQPASGPQTGVPVLSNGAQIAYGVIPGCLSCPMRTDAFHATKHTCAIVGSGGGQYYGPCPIPDAQTVGSLYNLICRGQELADRLEKWTIGWWANMSDGVWGESLFNATDLYGRFGYNFIDIRWLEVTAVDGNEIEVEFGNHDARSLWGHSPIQVGNGVLIAGNNQAAGAMPCIIPGGTTFAPTNGLVYAKPTNAILKLNQALTGGTERLDTGQPWSMQAGILCEASFPPTWMYLYYPDYFWGIKRIVEYGEEDEEWENGVFVLKDAEGNNTAVAAPNPNAANDNEKTFRVWVKDRTTQEWNEVDVGGVQGVPRRSVLYVEGSFYRNATTQIKLKIKHDAAVLPIHFSVTGGGYIENFSGLGSDFTMDLVFTAGSVPREVKVSFNPNGLLDDTGAPVDSAELTVGYKNTAPVLTGTTENSGSQMLVTVTSDDYLTGLTASDLTPTGCELDWFARFGSNTWMAAYSVAAQSGSPSLHLAAGACANLYGTGNAEGTLPLSAPSSTGLATWIGSAAGTYTALNPIVCLLYLKTAYTGTLAASALVLENCTVENWTKVNDQFYTFDCVPVPVSIDADERAGSAGRAPDQTTVKIQLPAGAIEYMIDDEPYENEASNEFMRNWWDTRFAAAIETTSTNESGGISADCSIQFGREIVDFTADKLTVTSGAVANFKFANNRYSWTLVPNAADSTVTCKLNQDAIHDLAGMGNTLSNTVQVDFTLSGEGAPTNSRLYISHDFGDVDHSTCVSELYLRGEVHGYPNFEDLLANADAVRIMFYEESSSTDYARRPIPIYSRRCRYSIPDKGGMWGLPGHDTMGWTWTCRLQQYGPRGASNYASACYLCGHCQFFEPLYFADYLNPLKAKAALSQLWSGYPGAKMQTTAGASGALAWLWCRVSHPSITGFLTPADQLTYHPMPGLPHWIAMGCGNFCYLDGETGETFQGLAHRHYAVGDEDAPESPALLPAGVLPTVIEGWDERKKRASAGALDDTSDPARTWRNNPGYNHLSTYRVEGDPVNYQVSRDIGLCRYRSQAYQHPVPEDLICPNIDPASGAHQDTTHGDFRRVSLDANFEPIAEDHEDQVYGALLRWKPGANPETGQSPPCYSYNDAYAVDDPISLGSLAIRRIELVSTGRYRIHVQPNWLYGVQGTVVSGTGPVLSLKWWLAGGNAVGLPESMRFTNWGVDYLNGEASVLYSSIGPEKGVREGDTLMFCNQTGAFTATDALSPRKFYYLTGDVIEGYEAHDTMLLPTPFERKTTNPYVGEVTYHEPHGFEVVRVAACAGDRVTWNGVESWVDEDQHWYFEGGPGACLMIPHNYEAWGSKCDIVEVLDHDGILAAAIAAETIGENTQFCTMNGYATVNSNAVSMPFSYARYGTSAWTNFSEQWVCVDRIMGLWALKKEGLATLESLGGNVCIKATASQGRICYAPLISARELNEPVQALQALDTCAMPIAVVETGNPVWAYYGHITRPTSDWQAQYEGFPAGIVNHLGNWDGVTYCAGLNGETAPGMARWGHPKPNGVGIDPREWWTSWPMTAYEIDVHHYDAQIANGYNVFLLVRTSGFYYISGFSCEDTCFYSASLNTAMELLLSPLMKQLPDGCVIEDAWADITASASSLYRATWHRLFVEGYLLGRGSTYRTFMGMVPNIGLEPVAWDEAGNPTTTVSEYLGAPEAVDEAWLTDVYDSGVSGGSPTVSAALVGLYADGGAESLGYSEAFDADGETHRVQIREIVDRWYARRYDFKNVGLALSLPQTPIIPSVSVGGTATIPRSPGQTEDGPLQHIMVYELVMPHINVTNPQVSITNAVVKFSLNGVASTIMCGGGVPFQLPAMA